LQNIEVKLEKNPKSKELISMRMQLSFFARLFSVFAEGTAQFIY